jgi:hypothetical protein
MSAAAFRYSKRREMSPAYQFSIFSGVLERAAARTAARMAAAA